MAALDKEYGVFFAFSTAQYEERRKEGVEYVPYIGGMLIPKHHYKEFLEKLNKLFKDAKQAKRNLRSKDKFIYEKLADHEAWYDGEYMRAFEDIRYVYPECTEEDLRRVYLKNRHRYD